MQPKKNKKDDVRKSYVVGSLIGLPFLDAGATFGYVPKDNKVLSYYLDIHAMRSPFGPGEYSVYSLGMRAFFGSFYLGAGVGKLDGTVDKKDQTDENGNEIIYNRDIVSRGAYVFTPHLGNMWRLGSTFLLGVQWVGLDIPIAKAGEYEEETPNGFHLCRFELGFSF